MMCGFTFAMHIPEPQPVLRQAHSTMKHLIFYASMYALDRLSIAQRDVMFLLS